MYRLLIFIGYLLVNIFIWFRANQLIKTLVPQKKGLRRGILLIYTLAHLFLMTTVISWTLFSNEAVVHTLKYLCNVWIGIFVYMIFWVCVAEVIAFIRWLVLRKKRRSESLSVDEKAQLRKGDRRFQLAKGLLVVVMVVAFSVYGITHWTHMKLKEYTVSIDKKCETTSHLKIALVSDLHLGYSVGDEQMQKMVKVINSQDVDLVVVAGDIIDNEYNAIDNPDQIAKTLSKIKSKYGVYGVYGNHDVEEKLVGGFTLYSVPNPTVQAKVDQMMKKANIKILEDDTVTIGKDIQLIGQIDEEKPNSRATAVKGKRKTIAQMTEKLDKSKLIIDLNHEPDQLDEKSAAGVDLDLCGHTHDGQIFPGNLTINLFWKNAYGYKKFGNMNSVVTSGAGVWGPAMRLGTDSEVVVVNVNLNGK